MNKYVISDIHGCNKTFHALLDKIKFSIADELYLLGDYVDRGPDSKGVIDTIMDLTEQGFRVKALRGNHEEMLYDGYTENLRTFGDRAALNSFGVGSINNIPKKYIDWIGNLEYYHEVDNYILVHGGLDFNNENPYENKELLVWLRDWYYKIDKKWLGNRVIIHGHTPILKNSIEKMLNNLKEIPVINIDNGCVFNREGYHQLCCLNLKNHELIFQQNIDGFYNPGYL